MAKVWADRPFPLIPTPKAKRAQASQGSLQVATAMALVHNALIRQLNSIYLQATGVKNAQDIADLLFYSRSFCQFLHDHHAAEETYFEPEIVAMSGNPNVFDSVFSEHRSFEPAMKLFEKYIAETKPEEYDGHKLRELIDGFAPDLLAHLRHEPDLLVEIGEKYGGDKLEKVHLDMEKRVLEGDIGKSWDNNIVMPIFYGSIDRDYEEGLHGDWPPFPWIMNYLIPWWFSRKHAGAWRFSPCANYRQRELPFVADVEGL